VSFAVQKNGTTFAVRNVSAFGQLGHMRFEKPTVSFSVSLQRLTPTDLFKKIIDSQRFLIVPEFSNKAC
jgi:hypothetical protein